MFEGVFENYNARANILAKIVKLSIINLSHSLNIIQYCM
jgi:hypothetical protein